MNDISRKDLGSRIKKYREYRGYSQEDIARVIGIPRSAISLIESGTRSIEAIELTKIAKVFDCSVDELMGNMVSNSSNSAQLIARATDGLSEDDRSEVLKFAEYLKSRRRQVGNDK